jgi:hypothetical protein
MKPQTRAMLLALSRRGEAGVSAMDALFEEESVCNGLV